MPDFSLLLISSNPGHHRRLILGTWQSNVILSFKKLQKYSWKVGKQNGLHEQLGWRGHCAAGQWLEGGWGLFYYSCGQMTVWSELIESQRNLRLSQLGLRISSLPDKLGSQLPPGRAFCGSCGFQIWLRGREGPARCILPSMCIGPKDFPLDPTMWRIGLSQNALLRLAAWMWFASGWLTNKPFSGQLCNGLTNLIRTTPLRG